MLQLRDDRERDRLGAVAAERQADRRMQARMQQARNLASEFAEQFVAPCARSEQADVSGTVAREAGKAARIEIVVVVHDQCGVEARRRDQSGQRRDAGVVHAIDAAAVREAQPARAVLEQFDAPPEQARQQQQEIIANAQKMAEKETARILEEASARAAQLEQQQVARIQQEAARARAELSRLVVNLSINAAGKVISRSVDSSDNRRLVEEFVSQAKER